MTNAVVSYNSYPSTIVAPNFCSKPHYFSSLSQAFVESGRVLSSLRDERQDIDVHVQPHGPHRNTPRITQQKRRSFSSLSGALGADTDAVLQGCQSPPGTFLPQTIWTTPFNSTLFRPQPSIDFNVSSARGISLEAAISRSCPAEWEIESMDRLSASSTKITLRILWPGYQPVGKSINISDDTYDRKPITKSKLAYNIAKMVMKTVQEHSNRRQSSAGHEAWAIGPHLSPSEIILAELRHVSEGSWQPALFIK
ncbi:hypothetical protein BC835DRAFT_1318156 [Cytidiella melzeri]|nr:hypothetical protein BC835DRAFT_1318156 [Cytidiella melzeri]